VTGRLLSASSTGREPVHQFTQCNSVCKSTTKQLKLQSWAAALLAAAAAANSCCTCGGAAAHLWSVPAHSALLCGDVLMCDCAVCCGCACLHQGRPTGQRAGPAATAAARHWQPEVRPSSGRQAGCAAGLWQLWQVRQAAVVVLCSVFVLAAPCIMVLCMCLLT
jgi:hypothetical protein